jgi:hypothetical protein
MSSRTHTRRKQNTFEIEERVQPLEMEALVTRLPPIITNRRLQVPDIKEGNRLRK